MKLFYLNEHKSCYNYARCVQEGFQYYIFDEGLEHEEELQNDCILFVLKGSLRLSCNEFQFTISEGKMVFVCRESLSALTRWKNVRLWLPCSRSVFGLVRRSPFQNCSI